MTEAGLTAGVRVSNRVHATAIVGPDVELGKDNVIGPNSIILGQVVIGDGNWIGPNVVIGVPPDGQRDSTPVGLDVGDVTGAGVWIGSGTIIREYVSVQQGVHVPTVIGNGCYLLRSSSVAHDVMLSDDVTLASGAVVGEHTHIWPKVTIGLNAIICPSGCVGPGTMVGMASVVDKEVGAFVVTAGNPARVTGVNAVGLSRLGCDAQLVAGARHWLTGSAEVPDALPEYVATLLREWSRRPQPAARPVAAAEAGFTAPAVS